VLSFSRFVLAATAPIIAGAMYERWGMDPPLYLVTALFAIAGLLLAVTPLARPAARQSTHPSDLDFAQNRRGGVRER